MTSVGQRQRVSSGSLAALALAAFLCLQWIAPSVQNPSWMTRLSSDKDETLHVYDSNAEWEAWKKSKWYIEPFEAEVHSLPTEQLEFQRKNTAKDLALYLRIIEDAISHRNSLGANTRLMVKWSGKLLAGYLDYRRNELKLKNKYDTRPAFFALLANIVEEIVDTSAKIKKEKKYRGRNIDIPLFQKRVTDILTHVKDIIDISPVGNYLKWNRMRLYMDNPSNPRYNMTMQDEASDLYAQFRSMNYEGSTFVARRIVNLLRIFSKGEVPPTTNFL